MLYVDFSLPPPTLFHSTSILTASSILIFLPLVISEWQALALRTTPDFLQDDATPGIINMRLPAISPH